MWLILLEKKDGDSAALSMWSVCKVWHIFQNDFLLDSTAATTITITMSRVYNKRKHGGCSELAKLEHIKGHNKVMAYLQWAICKHWNVKTKGKCYEHKQSAIRENDEATILWDMPV